MVPCLVLVEFEALVLLAPSSTLHFSQVLD